MLGILEIIKQQQQPQQHSHHFQLMRTSDDEDLASLERRRAINRKAAKKSRTRQKEDAVRIRKMFYDAQSANTKLKYEKKQLSKEHSKLLARWQTHNPSMCKHPRRQTTISSQFSTPPDMATSSKPEPFEEFGSRSEASSSRSTVLSRSASCPVGRSAHLPAAANLDSTDSDDDDDDFDDDFDELDLLEPSESDFTLMPRHTFPDDSLPLIDSISDASLMDIESLAELGNFSRSSTPGMNIDFLMDFGVTRSRVEAPKKELLDDPSGVDEVFHSRDLDFLFTIDPSTLRQSASNYNLTVYPNSPRTDHSGVSLLEDREAEHTGFGITGKVGLANVNARSCTSSGSGSENVTGNIPLHVENLTLEGQDEDD